MEEPTVFQCLGPLPTLIFFTVDYFSFYIMHTYLLTCFVSVSCSHLQKVACCPALCILFLQFVPLFVHLAN